MNNYIELILGDIKKLWGGLELSQKLLFCVVLISVIGALSFFIVKSTEPNWSVLYSDLMDQDVVGKLSEVYATRLYAEDTIKK